MIGLTATALGDLGYFNANCKTIQTDFYLNRPDNVGLVPAYHRLFLRNGLGEYIQGTRMPDQATHRVLAFMHDDLEILDGTWPERVQAEFEDPKVAIVGFGGAMGIGVPDIYKVPYALNQLQRIEYYSNQTGYDVHGRLEKGSRNVAVVDGFFMAIRTEFLRQIKGWTWWFPFGFHCYDTCTCLMAHRLGWKVRMVGVSCTHHGGGTSTKQEYKAMLEAQGSSVELDHTAPHAWMYREFQDVLPLRVAP